MGQVNNGTIAQVANQGLTVTTQILKDIGTIGGPVGQIIASIGQLGVMLAQIFSGCGNTCTMASRLANQVEPVLQQNLQTYLSSPVRTQSMQAAALNNFTTAWAALTQACGNPQLMAAGQSCIQDRQSGGCHWKASPGGWAQTSDGTCTYTPWGAAGSGTSCWNWFVGYHDPIANDPCVQPDSVLTAGGSSTSSTSGVVSGSDTIFGLPVPVVIGGLLLAAFLL
jgi:hypothetical protein